LPKPRDYSSSLLVSRRRWLLRSWEPILYSPVGESGSAAPFLDSVSSRRLYCCKVSRSDASSAAGGDLVAKLLALGREANEGILQNRKAPSRFAAAWTVLQTKPLPADTESPDSRNDEGKIRCFVNWKTGWYRPPHSLGAVWNLLLRKPDSRLRRRSSEGHERAIHRIPKIESPSSRAAGCVSKSEIDQKLCPVRRCRRW
jgi:hypothetical protein